MTCHRCDRAAGRQTKHIAFHHNLAEQRGDRTPKMVLRDRRRIPRNNDRERARQSEAILQRQRQLEIDGIWGRDLYLHYPSLESFLEDSRDLEARQTQLLGDLDARLAIAIEASGDVPHLYQSVWPHAATL